MAKAAAKHPIEVKIGVQYSPRELTLEVEMTADEIQAMVEQAVADNGVISITDVRGRQVLVPVTAFSYIEVGPPEARRVGFGAE